MATGRILTGNKDNVENSTTIDKPFRRRRLEKQISVCFGLIIDEKNATQFQQVINRIEHFTDVDTLVNFLMDIKDEEVFLLIINSLAQNIIPFIHELYHLKSVYIFNDKKMEYSEEWIKQYRKIKGLFKNMTDICEQLGRDIKRNDENYTSINILDSSFSQLNLNELEPSFMFSVILKEILLENNYNQTIRKDFADFYRQQYAENEATLRIIDLFEKNEANKSAIWWYTAPYFIYQILNYALRNQDFEIILRMGFFVQELHQNIERLHQHNSNEQIQIVYRGQGMSIEDFNKIKRSVGGLLSFNSFLSTSRDRNVSLMYADCTNNDRVGILFEIAIDSSIRSSPFASLDRESFFHNQEKEVLFSMHTVFRITDVKKIERNIWHIHLRMTNDDEDPELKQLSQHMRKIVEGGGKTGLHRLGKLTIEMGAWDKAKEIYDILATTTDKENKREFAHFYHQLGYICQNQDDHDTALSHYQKSLELYLTYLRPDHPTLSTTYSNIGMIFKEKGQFNQALQNFQRALDIEIRSKEPVPQAIASIHSNIGLILQEQDRLDEALKSFQQCLDLELKVLPSTHPSLAISYYNIGVIYFTQENFLKALEFYEKCISIQRKSLPPMHSSSAVVYANMACACDALDRSNETIKYAQMALDIARHNFPTDHPQVQQYQFILHEFRSTISS